MILVFDTETTRIPTGFEYQWMACDCPRAIEICAILYQVDGTEIEVFSTLIRQNVEDSQLATEIHGITQAMLRDGAEIEGVLLKLLEMAEKANTIVCHNVAYDSMIVMSEMEKSGKFTRRAILETFGKMQMYCTMETGKYITKIEGKKGYKWPKLPVLYKKLFDREMPAGHRAEVDVRATAECYFSIKNNMAGSC